MIVCSLLLLLLLSQALLSKALAYSTGRNKSMVGWPQIGWSGEEDGWSIATPRKLRAGTLQKALWKRNNISTNDDELVGSMLVLDNKKTGDFSYTPGNTHGHEKSTIYQEKMENFAWLC